MEKPHWVQLLKRRGTPLFFQYNINVGIYHYFRRLYELDFEFKNYKYRDVDGPILMDGKELGEASELIEERIQEGSLEQFADPISEQCDSLLNTSEAIFQLDWEELSDSKLGEWLREYTEEVQTLTPSLPGIPITEKVIQEMISSGLEEVLKKKGKEQKLESYLDKLIFPSQKSLHEKATVELKEIAALVQNSSELRELFQRSASNIVEKLEEKQTELLSRLKSYVQKYGFMNMEYWAGDPLTIEEVVENVQTLVELKDCEEALEKTKEQDRKTQQEYEEIVKELQIPEELLNKIEFAKELFYLRQHRADSFFLAGFRVRGFLEQIANRMGLTYSDLMYLTPEEVIGFLKNEKEVDTGELENRQENGYGLYLINGEHKIITGEELTKEVEEEKEVLEIDKLTGNVAYPGSYKGQVKIVATEEQIDKMENGDVLVSPMTDPYFMPAIVKAGAIITDEGGMLSHAAIVSRELHIPCVVGTENATRALKDGDLVEIDAEEDQGVVNIGVGNP